ncbi:peptidoglycan/LPS O-acetylase OafA/YrhL [Pararhizobium capsulatum DSM 1112]|uniref:Peptidoglycan/LPS O-acetylase OafA/YrhL n=1 Tax=Pararhizobium capsulatum DSM 1112 TaxID=1121113 RepID=A0ABU0BTE2_9HYPH|nr:acyltransferase family protein [Pararhizobium capsulatum]MDQ0320720.1 peptidoglycan/LPS O-acetylase OafA/YrhL [Pararhizobium capsulatum DSM 1112]
MQYRREIDGLRAVAVVPVILFHAGLEYFSGGFIGVDIFFVISGYLITSIIISEQEKGGFSILRFYERRARRIVPVLSFVLLCCLPFAWAWMLPAQMESFGASLIAVSLFASNVLFWQEAGYFAPSAELQPLLHTWSLAVEEQYYVVFPLAVMLLWRFGRPLVIAVIAAVALLSLGLAQYGSENFATANFYLPTSRAWELLTGSLCAFLVSAGYVRNSNILSVAGLVLICIGIFAYDAATPYPSFYTAVPVIGTAFIILFGWQGTWTATLLSTRPFVGIGLISYSLYLWHQPIFAFARIRALTEPSQTLLIGLAILAFPLAYLSWRFVEAPFRKGPLPFLPSSMHILGATGLLAALFIGVGLATTRDNGLQFRLPPEALTALASQEHPNPIMVRCLYDKGEAKLDHPVKDCLTPGAKIVDTILIGDSHAAAMAGETMRVFEHAGADLYVMTHSACVGFSGFYVFDAKYKLRCNAFFSGIEDYIRNSNVKTVVMLSRWTLYVEGTPFDNGEGGIEQLKPLYVDLYDRRNAPAGRDDPERKERVLKQYVADIEDYLKRGFNVVLVYPIPEAGWDVPGIVAKAALTRSPLQFSTSLERYRQRNEKVITAFDGLSHPNLRKIKPSDNLCDKPLAGRCINSLDADTIYYFDDDHLSDAGAALIAPAILDAVQSFGQGETRADKLAVK